jgi:hypothetical protein
MKLNKRKGVYFMTFTEEEIKQMKSILTQGETIAMFPEEQQEDVFKHLRKKTRGFLEELLEVYGRKGHFEIDKKFEEIRWKHRILDMYAIFNRFEESGHVVLFKDDNKIRRKIKSIQFNF